MGRRHVTRFEMNLGSAVVITRDEAVEDVGQRQRWPGNDSPLSVLLNPNQDLSRFAHVVQDDAQVLMIEARDPRRREFGTITLGFTAASGSSSSVGSGPLPTRVVYALTMPST